MQRRQYLAAAGVALAVPVAGCLEDAADDDGGAGTDDDDTGDDGRDDTGNGGDDDTGNGDDGDDDDSGGDDDGEVIIPEDPRVDEPPYDVSEPEYPDDPTDDEEWDERYLCAAMPEEPSQEFEPVQASLRRWELDIDSPNPSYHVRLVTSHAELEEWVAVDDSPDANRLADVDFDDETVVIVESGFGSGSVSHHWKRVAVEDGIVHLHGCYTQPLLRTDDYTARHSVLVVERPETLSFARVSLTVDSDRRVHVNSTEGVVSPED